KKLLALALVVGSCWLAWSRWSHESEAVKAYRDFAHAWAYMNYETARDLTLDGSAARKMVDDRIDLIKKAGGMGATFGINSLSHRILEEKVADGGKTVTLKAQQSIRVSGMGQESAFGRPATDEHVVTLKKDGATWKVAIFQERQL